MIGKPTRGKAVDVELIKRLYKKGLSFNAIGKKTGHHHSIIAYHIYKSGIQIRPRIYYQKSKVSKEIVAKLYQEGFSTPEIAKRFGLTNQSIHTKLIKAGVKRRSFSEALNNAVKRGRVSRASGKDHYSWKGGRYLAKGYINLTINTKRFLEHRYVWEQHYGKIPKGWVVHHLNGNKEDNRLENLHARSRKMHSPQSIVEPYRNRILELENELKKFIKLERS